MREALAVVGITVACAAAGVSATAVAPATAQTRHYQATVSLDPDPFHRGELVATTAFGDIEVGFAGVAPGIRTVPQVKASIAEVLARPGVSLSTLRPGPEELSAAIRDVAVAVMGRFAAGALAVVVALLLGYAVLRRRPPPTALVATALAGSLLATAATAGSLWLTYQPDRQETFTSTGVLGTLQRNQGILSDVEARATQVAPYLRNLLALSTALQQKYSAAPLAADTSLRVLLVSDIHGGNQYSLMRTIVEEEGIDLVVDAGDLVNFGTVEEGEAAGIFAGIESVGVPYLFVRGNHDATSATDTSVLDRMSRIPNVVLLEPPTGGYTEVTRGRRADRRVQRPAVVRRLRHRLTGQAGAGPRGLRRRVHAGARRRTSSWATSRGRCRACDAGVLVNGHMHSVDLEGNRVQAGTFTGGGPLSHFLADAAGEELVGQPSAFDVLTFGTDCRLASLTRYRFRDVIEGRPAYDDVSLVNGRRVDRREPDPARACVADEPVTTTAVPAASTAPAPASPPPAERSQELRTPIDQQVTGVRSRRWCRGGVRVRRAGTSGRPTWALGRSPQLSGASGRSSRTTSTTSCSGSGPRP